MKKLIVALLAATLILSPAGNFLFQDHTITAEAKSYKSGKKSFNAPSKPAPSKAEKKEDSVVPNKAANTPNAKGGFFSGGLMKGLFIGGLAGLLFGSLFANMGMLGSILGFAINMLAIFFLIFLIRKVFALLKEKKKKEDVNPWRS
ncbi:Na+/alanine symporter [Bacillus sp. OxB-1]|uniref:hypothetical protein n=1 Tax=Bacillus sp. (strain OxB-1) TaxID=98228 RepID=UPI00058227FB|nr:hypothetical protein [Bacillus sp. OxB-1]BAQ09351.1 Na+/alanine symporter [Bacillus sp. OxB-1]